MNLIEQLKQTPKWYEFRKWWNENYQDKLLAYYWEDTIYIAFDYWCQFPFEMQESVFETFIYKDSQTCIFKESWMWCLHFPDKPRLCFNSVQELILWYFNN
jgi:hypothetical protein